MSVLEQALVEAVHLQARPPPAPAPQGQLARPQSSPALPTRQRVRHTPGSPLSVLFITNLCTSAPHSVCAPLLCHVWD